MKHLQLLTDEELLDMRNYFLLAGCEVAAERDELYEAIYQELKRRQNEN